MLIPMRSNIQYYVMQMSHECWEGDTGNAQAHAAEVETVYLVGREGRGVKTNGYFNSSYRPNSGGIKEI